MKEQWILVVKTDIENPKQEDELLNSKYMLFEDYGQAKRELIKILKSYTFSENIMFDGNGHSKLIEMYFDHLIKMAEPNYQINYEFDYKFFVDYLHSACEADLTPDNSFFKVLKALHEALLEDVNKDNCLVGNNAKEILEVINRVFRCEQVDLHSLDSNIYENLAFSFIKSDNEIMLKNSSWRPMYFYMFLKTNMINMFDKKDYYFYFGHDYMQNTEPSIFIELKKVEKI